MLDTVVVVITSDSYVLDTDTTHPLSNHAKSNADNSIGKQKLEEEERPSTSNQPPPIPKSPKDETDIDPPTNQQRKEDTGRTTTTRDETITGASPRISAEASEAGEGGLLEKTRLVAKRAVLVGKGGSDEERRLLVNASVAVLVIAALGFYISYKFGSSGKTTKD